MTRFSIFDRRRLAADGQVSFVALRSSIRVDYSRALFNYANLVKEEGEEVDVLSPQRPEMSVVIPIGEIALIRRHTEGLSESFLPID